MARRIEELFGYAPDDTSAAARQSRGSLECPFIEQQCLKRLNDGTVSGVCTLTPATSAPVICCPIRLYADEYKVLRDVAGSAFGRELPFVQASKFVRDSFECVAVFGKRWGKELRLPSRSARGQRTGAYFVDWVLAHVSRSGELLEFVAVEVQSIDTTGNYREERAAYLNGRAFTGRSTAGLNWENVNKRILPQIIYKGHVLRQEPLCSKGLYFICPDPVYGKMLDRLGKDLRAYQPQPGALTVATYDLGALRPAGTPRELVASRSFTTTIDQVALAFTAPRNLPPSRAYEQAICAGLGRP